MRQESESGQDTNASETPGGNDADGGSKIEKRTFWCFISYRHTDNHETGRQWASWIHHSLETYEVPTDLVGQTNERGDVIPARIYPVFRDEEELPVDSDLSQPIFRALDVSKFLLVICSPRAVQSRYVAEEIRYYKSLGYENRVLAAMIEGVPNASADRTMDGTRECFPEPLRRKVGRNGELLEELAEPVAADFRLEEGEQGWCIPEAYREALKSSGNLSAVEIEKRVGVYRKRCDLMLLKIVAGVLGVPLGTLTQRDKEYQLVLARKRAKVLRRWLAGVGVSCLLAVAGAVVAAKQTSLAREREADAIKQKAIAVAQEEEAVRQKGIAEVQEAEARKQEAEAKKQEALAKQQEKQAVENMMLANERLADVHYREAIQLLSGPLGHQVSGFRELVSALEVGPEYLAAQRMLEREASTRTWIVPDVVIETGSPLRRVWMDEEGKKAMTLAEDGSLSVFDVEDGKRISHARLFANEERVPEVVHAAGNLVAGEVALLCRVPLPRVVVDEEETYKIDWSWEIRRYQADGTLAGRVLVDSLNGRINSDPFFIGVREERFQDDPLWYYDDEHLVLLHETGYELWKLDEGLRVMISHKWPWSELEEEPESLAGWTLMKTGDLKLLTSGRVAFVKLLTGRNFELHKIVFDDYSPFFPRPDTWSGMLSFGEEFGSAAVSGATEASHMLPEGFGVNVPNVWKFNDHIDGGGNKQYSGVFRFLSGGGFVMVDSGDTDAHVVYSKSGSENDVNNLETDDGRRATEWPPFAIEERGDRLVMVSAMQSGASAPQLIEVVDLPKEDGAGPRWQRQVLAGATVWVSADGERLAQMDGERLVIYRFGLSLDASRGKRIEGERPYSADKREFDISSAALPEATGIFPKGEELIFRHEGREIVLPGELANHAVVDVWELPNEAGRVILFGKVNAVGSTFDEDQRDWQGKFFAFVMPGQGKDARLIGPVGSISVDRSGSALAVSDGTEVRIESVADGEEIITFRPERMSNHMVEPAHTVFYSLDDSVLGVGSLVESQDSWVELRVFDAETGAELESSMGAEELWDYDLFPGQKGHEGAEWRDKPVADPPLSFFKKVDAKRCLERLEGRPFSGVEVVPDDAEAAGWSILKFPREE